MKQWEQFEEAVAVLLASAGMDVKKNRLVGHMKVDMIASRREFGRNIVMAVECKDHMRPLDKATVAEVFVTYESLIEGRLIDELMIVTSKGLATTAATYADTKRFLRHLTLDQLQANIIGFDRYLANIEQTFAASGLSDYFIHLALATPDGSSNLGDAVDYILNWLETPDLPPLALMSGYGTGKSTLSLYIANHLGKKHALDQSVRIPVLVDLGKVSDVQGLDGLLGKLMTANNAVTNYSFPLFMELNRRGRFLIILDGFDEMKHGISWEAFMSNMEEIRKLIDGKAKVLVCGRPSIFLDEAEHVEALQGKRKVGDTYVSAALFRGFREVTILPLTPEQISTYLRDYLSFLVRAGHVRLAAATRTIRRLAKEGGGGFYDLASRPVQLNMLANVLPSWDKPLDRLTRILLFDEFINIIISRESKKGARMQISARSRRDFSRLLAWHMWTQIKSDHIRTDEIPDALIEATHVDISDPRAAKRELIAGCCLELKPPDLLRFGHRSLQEFLVAQEVVSQLKHGAITIPRADSVMTPEIREFVQGTIKNSVDDFIPALLNHHGVLPPWWEKLAKYPPIVRRMCDLVRFGVISAWPGVFTVYSTRNRRSPQVLALSAVSRLGSCGTYPYMCMALHCLAMALFPRTDGDVPSVEMIFVEKLREMTKKEVTKEGGPEKHKKQKSEMRGELLALLKQIAIYATGRTRLELGTLRKTIIDVYSSTGCLSDMLSQGRLSAGYDFYPTVSCSSQLADCLRELRESLEAERM